jgi:PAS domain S-box-containing protein
MSSKNSAEDNGHSKEELLEELTVLRRRVSEMEALEVERSRVQDSLKESEQRLRFIAETTGDVIYRLRYDTMSYDYLSPSIEKLIGYTPEEIQSLGFASLVTRIEMPDRSKTTPEGLRRNRQEGKTGELHADYLVCTRDGDMRWLRDHSFPWRDDAGRLMGSVGILSDISELKHVDEALRRSEGELRFLASKLLVVQEEERALIAKDLHDRISQTLAAVKIEIELAIGSARDGKSRSTIDSLERALPLVRGVLEHVRRIYMGLRPSILDDFGIIATLNWLGRELRSAQHQIRIEIFAGVEESEIPEPLKLVIFKIAQQGLENAIKHSGGELVRLTLEKSSGVLELIIEDDGGGFDPTEAGSEEVAKRGFGLISMRERADSSGGAFTLRSSLGTGTVLRVRWPHWDSTESNPQSLENELQLQVKSPDS